MIFMALIGYHLLFLEKTVQAITLPKKRLMMVAQGLEWVSQTFSAEFHHQMADAFNLAYFVFFQPQCCPFKDHQQGQKSRSTKFDTAPSVGQFLHQIEFLFFLPIALFEFGMFQLRKQSNYCVYMMALSQVRKSQIYFNFGICNCLSVRL